MPSDRAVVAASLLLAGWLAPGAMSSGTTASGTIASGPAFFAGPQTARVDATEPPQRGRVLYPRLSPDGEQVAFSAAQRIWVMDIFARQPQRLTDMEVVEMHPVWAPDRPAIAFVALDEGEGVGHVWEADLTGATAPRRVTQAPGFYAFPSYSMDGRRLVALKAPERTWRQWAGRIEAARRADDEIGPFGLQILTVPAFGLSLGDPSVSVGEVRDWGRPHLTAYPGRVFFYEPGTGLFSMRLDGSDRRNHLRATVPAPPGGDTPTPVDEVLLSPRGDRVLLRQGGRVYLMPLPQVGGEAVEVSLEDPDTAPFPLTQVTDTADTAAFSTGGTAVIFARGNTVAIYHIETGDSVEVEIPETIHRSRPGAGSPRVGSG